MAEVEGLVFDGLDLNPASPTTYILEGLEMPDPEKRPEWADGADQDGSLLVRDPLVANREIVAQVRVMASTRDLLHDAVGALVDKVEEAERHDGGLALVWTPADGTESLTFYVLTGQVEGLPINWQNGYFVRKPLVTLRLTCKPFGYGAEETVAATTAATPIVELTVAAAKGDVPAEGRLIVTDNATQDRLFVAWGREWRHYSVSNDLLRTSDELTVTGFGGTTTTQTGAYSSGTNVKRGTLNLIPLAVCGTGNLPHVGTYRVVARVYASSADVKVRMAWREGNGPLHPELWKAPPKFADWCEVDLGLVSIPEKLLGTQRWQAQVEAYSDTVGDMIDVDYLILIPAEAFGKARQEGRFTTPTAFSVRDEFDQTAGALNGKTLPSGGTWSSTGGGTDFSVDATEHIVTRTAVSDGAGYTALASSSSLSALYYQIDLRSRTKAPSSGNAPHIRLISNYTGATANNYLVLYPSRLGHGADPYIEAGRLSGSDRKLGKIWLPAGHPRGDAMAQDVWYTLRLVTAGGRFWVWWFERGQEPAAPLFAGDGFLDAAGQIGFRDAMTFSDAWTRDYDNVIAGAISLDAVCFSGQSIEFRHDEPIREDSTGTYWGPLSPARGAPFLIPPAGDENRSSRIAVVARRNDIETMAEPNVSDSTTVQVIYRPRYLTVPR